MEYCSPRLALCKQLHYSKEQDKLHVQASLCCCMTAETSPPDFFKLCVILQILSTQVLSIPKDGNFPASPGNPVPYQKSDFSENIDNKPIKNTPNICLFSITFFFLLKIYPSNDSWQWIPLRTGGSAIRKTELQSSAHENPMTKMIHWSLILHDTVASLSEPVPTHTHTWHTSPTQPGRAHILRDGGLMSCGKGTVQFQTE